MNRKNPPMPPARKESLTTASISPKKTASSPLLEDSSSAESSPRHTTPASSAFDTPPCSPFVSAPTARVLSTSRKAPAPPLRSPTTRLSASSDEVVRQSSESSGAECNASTAAARDVQLSAPKDDEKSIEPVQGTDQDTNTSRLTLSSPPSRPLLTPPSKPKSRYENVDFKNPDQNSKAVQLQHRNSKPKRHVAPPRPPRPSTLSSSLPAYYRQKKLTKLSHQEADPTVIVSRREEHATKKCSSEKKKGTPPVKPPRKPARQHSLQFNSQMVVEMRKMHSSNDFQSTVQETEQVAEGWTHEGQKTLTMIKADIKVRKHQSMKMDTSYSPPQGKRMITDLNSDACFVPSRPLAPNLKQETSSITHKSTPHKNLSTKPGTQPYTSKHSLVDGSIQKSPKLPLSSASKQTSTANGSPHSPRTITNPKRVVSKQNPEVESKSTSKLPSSQVQDSGPKRPPRAKSLALNKKMKKSLKNIMKPVRMAPQKSVSTVSTSKQPAAHSEMQVRKVNWKRGGKPIRPAPPPPVPGALISPYAEFNFDHVSAAASLPLLPNGHAQSKKENDCDGDDDYIFVNSGVSVHKVSWPAATMNEIINQHEESIYTPLTIASMNNNGLYCEIDYSRAERIAINNPGQENGAKGRNSDNEVEDNLYIEMRTPYEEVDFGEPHKYIDTRGTNSAAPREEVDALEEDSVVHKDVVKPLEQAGGQGKDDSPKEESSSHKHSGSHEGKGKERTKMDDQNHQTVAETVSLVKRPPSVLSDVTQITKEVESSAKRALDVTAASVVRKTSIHNEDNNDSYCYIYLDRLRIHPPSDQSTTRTHSPSSPAVTNHTTNGLVIKQIGANTEDKLRHAVSMVIEQDSTPPPAADNITNNNKPRVSYENTILPLEKSRHKSVESCSMSSTTAHKLEINGLSVNGDTEGDRLKPRPLRCPYVNLAVLPETPHPVADSRQKVT